MNGRESVETIKSVVNYDHGACSFVFAVVVEDSVVGKSVFERVIVISVKMCFLHTEDQVRA